jgi:hypothetical protein
MMILYTCSIFILLPVVSCEYQGTVAFLTIPSQASLLYRDVSVLVAGRDLVAGQEHRRANLQVSLEMGYGINFMVIK